ncbi:MAG: hypothetical protein EBU97_03435 [Rhodobacteraceae bacterium]|nr:hypothetical protein [Paracoccaceae bacterium]
MMRRAVIIAALLVAPPAQAALSGFYDSATKIEAILADGAVADALHQAPVGQISNTGTTKDGNDLWVVRTQECDLGVAVIADLPKDGMVGMTTYSVKIVTPCP